MIKSYNLNSFYSFFLGIMMGWGEVDSSRLKTNAIFSELAWYKKNIQEIYNGLNSKSSGNTFKPQKQRNFKTALNIWRNIQYSSRCSYPGFGLFVEVSLYEQAAYGQTQIIHYYVHALTPSGANVGRTVQDLLCKMYQKNSLIVQTVLRIRSLEENCELISILKK